MRWGTAEVTGAPCMALCGSSTRAALTIVNARLPKGERGRAERKSSAGEDAGEAPSDRRQRPPAADLGSCSNHPSTSQSAPNRAAQNAKEAVVRTNIACRADQMR